LLNIFVLPLFRRRAAATVDPRQAGRSRWRSAGTATCWLRRFGPTVGCTVMYL